jgi:hypothetical protein
MSRRNCVSSHKWRWPAGRPSSVLSSTHADGAGPPSARKRRDQSIYGWLLSVIENFGDFFDRVPIASSRGHAEELLELAEEADRLHLPTIEA